MKNFLFSLLLLFSTIAISQTDQESPLTIVEQMPAFPGGETEMFKFIQQNIKYPQTEKDANISGTCYVTFVVEKDGSITNIKVLRGVKGGPGCDTEAIRIVSIMPHWSAGKQNDKEVRVQYNLPIKYTLRSTVPYPEKDITYYNSHGIKSSKEESEHYRVIFKQDHGYLVKDFYTKNNYPKMIAACSKLEPMVKDGKCVNYSEDGKKLSEGNYVDNKQAGIWNIWQEGEKDSLVVDCLPDSSTYTNVYIPKSHTYNTEYNKPYKIQVYPEFPGGEFAMMKFIQTTVRYPQVEKEAGISGTCYITFEVDSVGQISGITLLKGVLKGPGCDKESLRVVNLMPSVWKPYTEYGRPMKFQFNLPIRYTLR